MQSQGLSFHSLLFIMIQSSLQQIWVASLAWLPSHQQLSKFCWLILFLSCFVSLSVLHPSLGMVQPLPAWPLAFLLVLLANCHLSCFQDTFMLSSCLLHFQIHTDSRGTKPLIPRQGRWGWGLLSLQLHFLTCSLWNLLHPIFLCVLQLHPLCSPLTVYHRDLTCYLQAKLAVFLPPVAI